MRTLFIDVGNSYIKAVEKTGPDWNICFKNKLDGEAEFYEWLKKRNDQKIVVCSVVWRITQVLNHTYSGRKLKIIDVNALPEHLIDYHTPQTLGVDRFLVCHGAVQFSKKHVVVIDSGSACTIDIMTADGVYRGGVIMPGLSLIREFMSEKLPSLPVSGCHLPGTWPGKSSIDSILWGTAGMMSEAIVGFLRKYTDKFGSYDLFLTGGGANVIADLLKNEMKFVMNPHLLFEGMKMVEMEYLRS